jgi:hypothetical protein
MGRKLLVGVAITVAVLVAPTAALAATPYAYHTLHSWNAFASFNLTQDHYAITVWVFTTSGRFSLKPGAAPLNSTSSYTAVEIVVQDLDQPAGKGYLEVADWSGQAWTSPRFRGALAGATITASVPLEDWHSGNTAVASIQVVWRATGPSVTRPSHWHIRYPRIVTILSNSNDNQRPAVATATVTFDGTTLLAGGTDDGAGLESVKFNCRQVGYRQRVDFGACTAFNG